MVDNVLKWVAKELPYIIFWEVYFDLTKLDVTVSTAVFQDAIKRYISNSCNDFLETALEVCHDNREENIEKVMELVTSTGEILTRDKMLTFFTDLLNTAPDDNTAPSTSTSTSSKQVDTILSCALDYIEKHDVDILTWECTETVLRKFSCVCVTVYKTYEK